jgi:hypothetical protein
MNLAAPGLRNRLSKGAAMNARQLVVASLALASLGACASPGPVPQSESRLEVLERAEAAPSAPAPAAPGKACPADRVTYCEHDSGTVRCSCQDREEVRRWMVRSFGVN